MSGAMFTEIKETVRKGYQKIVGPVENNTMPGVSEAPRVRATELRGIGSMASKDLLHVASNLKQCEVLQSKKAILASNQLVKLLNLPSHHDFQKDWDTLKVFHYILENAAPGDAILDAGSGSKSVILNWLHLNGFKNLVACDRLPLNAESYEKRKIEFTVQDLAKTSYKDRQFKAISCVSVVEHGVDLRTFFHEMGRILDVGGVLLVSTDYWEKPIDCSEIYPYGKQYGQMKVFTAEDARAMIGFAEEASMELCTPVELSSSEKAVRWERVDRDYTFLFLAFRRK